MMVHSEGAYAVDVAVVDSVDRCVVAVVIVLDVDVGQVPHIAGQNNRISLKSLHASAERGGIPQSFSSWGPFSPHEPAVNVV